MNFMRGISLPFLGTALPKIPFLSSQKCTCTPVIDSCRSITNYSLMKGKQKSSKPVVDRFFRLNWGIWIRTKAGRDKHLWKKSETHRRVLRQHVFVNATQTRLLDRMVTPGWRRPRHWVDDPYLPYQERENFMTSRKRPLP